MSVRRIIEGALLGVGLGAGLFLFQSLAPRRAAASPASITGAEYRVEPFFASNSGAMQDTLNKRAAEGWRLIAATPNMLFLERDRQ